MLTLPPSRRHFIGWLLLVSFPNIAVAQVGGDRGAIFAGESAEASASHPTVTTTSRPSSASATQTATAEASTISPNVTTTNQPNSASKVPAATAEPLPASRAFGDSGVVVLGGSIGVRSVSFTNSEASHTSLFVEPGIDYFITDAVSLGGFVLGSYSKSKGYDYFGPLMETRETGYGAGARFGVNIAIGKSLSIWPKVGFGITHYNTVESVSSVPAYLSQFGPSRSEFSTNATWVELYVPLLVHVAPHFFLGVGPSIYSDLNRSVTFEGSPSREFKRTGIAFAISTGGWI